MFLCIFHSCLTSQAKYEKSFHPCLNKRSTYCASGSLIWNRGRSIGSRDWWLCSKGGWDRRLKAFKFIRLLRGLSAKHFTFNETVIILHSNFRSKSFQSSFEFNSQLFSFLTFNTTFTKETPPSSLKQSIVVAQMNEKGLILNLNVS